MSNGEGLRRRLLVSMLDGLALIEQATSPSVLRAAVRLVREPAHHLGAYIPPEMTDDQFLNALRIFHSALRSSPPDQPLYFHIPPFVTFSVGSYCAFQCPSCYASSTATVGGDRQIDARLVEQLCCLETICISMLGGEPLHYRNFVATAEKIRSAGKYLQVYTNADVRVMTPLLAERRSGVAVIQTIAGAPTDHDFIRGRDAYRRLIDNLEQLSRLGAPLRLHARIPRSSVIYRGLIDTLNHVTRRFDLYGLSVFSEVRVGRIWDSDGSDPIRFDEVQEQMQALFSNRVREISFDSHHFKRSKSMTRQGGSFLDIGNRPACNAGYLLGHVDSTGAVKPCPAFETQAPAHAPPEHCSVASALSAQQARFWKRIGNGCLAESTSGACND